MLAAAVRKSACCTFQTLPAFVPLELCLFSFPFSHFQPRDTEAASVQHLAVLLGAHHGHCSHRALLLLDVQAPQAGLSSRACSHPGEPLLQDLGFFKGVFSHS